MVLDAPMTACGARTCLGIERGAHPPKGVVAGDAVGQCEKRAQPILLARPKSAKSTKDSAPQSMAHMAKKRAKRKRDIHQSVYGQKISFVGIFM